jgi:tryptophan synthase alpha chain
VFLVAPSSTEARLSATVDASRGFVYAAATMGVTGARAAVDEAAQQLVARVRRLRPNVTVCVGLGVSTTAQAAEVAAFADGVIVGSAFVRRVLDAADDHVRVAAVTRLAGELAVGVRTAH